MVEKDFSLRLAQLRERKGVSARDMSLSMGQNPGYINNIESGKSMPSLAGIFYICDYAHALPDHKRISMEKMRSFYGTSFDTNEDDDEDYETEKIAV